MDEKSQHANPGANTAAESSPLWKEDKAEKINTACLNRDIEALIELATSPHGLLIDGYRRRAWPVILGCTGEAAKEEWHNLPRHRDEGQVKLDVDRAFVYYPDQDDEKAIQRRKDDLLGLITCTLRRHPSLNYFQGYHDIVQLLLLVIGNASAPEPVARLSLLRLRDFMLPTLSGTTPHLNLLPSILEAADPELARHLSPTEPFFALSATLTMYAHDIEDFNDITRLFDFLLAHEASMAVYFYAAIILSRKASLFSIPDDEPEMLHFTLSKLPKPLDIEVLITDSVSLFRNHPPASLPNRAWNRISSSSVLKTTQDAHALQSQTLREGERWLDRQATQIKRMQQLQDMRARAWGMRRQGGWFGAALVVGVLSYWFRSIGREGLLGMFGHVWVWMRSWF